MSPGDGYHDTAGYRKVLAGPSSSCAAPWKRNSNRKPPTKRETIKPISSYSFSIILSVITAIMKVELTNYHISTAILYTPS